jgi:DNA-binding GntR family transcriptional regulator
VSAERANRLGPAGRRPLGQAVADVLRDAIYAGRFRPGDRIAQAVVARELGVSQTTVRDALAALEHEGLVRRGPNQGAVVARLSRADVEEIVTLRSALEALAVRRVVHRATPEQLARLEENVRVMKGSSGAGRVADLDLQFHELLVRFAGHQRLLACWQTLRSQLKLLLVSHNLRDPRSPEKTVRHHRQLIRLLKARDEAGAVALLERGGDAYRVQLLSE